MNRYWVGGAGTWDGSSTTHWSASSGGSSGASVPGSADTAIFDASSGGGSVTISGAALDIQGFNSSGFAGTFASGEIQVVSGGAVTLGVPLPGLTVESGESTSLTCNGHLIGSATFYGEVTCADALKSSALVLGPATILVLFAGSTSTAYTINWPDSAVSATLGSSSPGTQATLSRAAGTNNVDYITVTDIAFTGGATWYWGTGYTDGGNNSGITTPPAGGGGVTAILFGDVA